MEVESLVACESSWLDAGSPHEVRRTVEAMAIAEREVCFDFIVGVPPERVVIRNINLTALKLRQLGIDVNVQ